jgi:hypothetical protein
MSLTFLFVGASVLAFAPSAIAALPAVAVDEGTPDVTNLRQLQGRCGNDAAAFFTRQKQLRAKEKPPC